MREAWEIGRNDYDSGGILPGDDPTFRPIIRTRPFLNFSVEARTMMVLCYYRNDGASAMQFDGRGTPTREVPLASCRPGKGSFHWFVLSAVVTCEESDGELVPGGDYFSSSVAARLDKPTVAPAALNSADPYFSKSVP